MPRSSAAKARPAVQPVPQPVRPQAHEKNGSSASPNHSAPASREHQDHALDQQAATSVHPAEPPVEPEDAYLTGTTRSLQRRVLGLNVDGHHAQQHPESPAGQHATGSFTDRNGENA
jgi:hypothetical protein